MSSSADDARRATLRAVCDTIVPRLEREPDPHGHWGRAASDLGVDGVLEGVIAGMAPAQREGLGALLDALAEQGFAGCSQHSREQLLRNLAMAGPAAEAGAGALTALTLFLHYGLPENPNWATFGYPGPASPPPASDNRIAPLEPSGDGCELEADVVVVGSGAGGGVIAGTLARAGLKVVVLEAGGCFAEADFLQLEIVAYQQLYWRGGPTPTADGNVSLQAGATLGGGTVVNWTNCLRTTPWVREQWAREHGLEGVDGPEYDRHLDAVLGRLGANADCSDLNGPQRMMRAGAEALGWAFETAVRNADPARYDPVSAGYMGFGDQSGSKQSTAKTYLADAVAEGADVLVRTRAERVLSEGGRAAGVEALYDGRVPVTVRAPRVVVACGALESPALLRRSGIGGPAVGANLRLHPCTAVFGRYGSDLEAWWGAPHAGLVHEFENVEDGYGFLVEGTQYGPALAASAIPFTTAAAHKEMMAEMAFGASFIALLRDRGAGRVTVDDAGQPVVSYALTDELDVRNARRGLDALVRLHAAAGAHQVSALATGLPTWRRGDDLDAFVARVQRVPLRAGGHRLFSAHQMGTCRMGTDPAASVADPWGQLHDVPGVWIGDGSAFPTSSGTNPMISIMALAHRTAEAIAGTTAPERPLAATS